jgi:hypothetical protein
MTDTMATSERTELRSVRATNRELTAENLAAHLVAAEVADENDDGLEAKWHRNRAAILQAPQPSTLDVVDWPRFWSRDRSGAFLVEPLIPRGRQIGLYGPAKVGKSELAQYLAAGFAAGRDLNGDATEPGVVLYLDFEMSEDDLEERLRDFGYGPDSDLSRLVYAQHPPLPPLDTRAGGLAVAAEIDAVGADLLIIDTLSKVVEGEENSADTYRRFAQHTGSLLRQRHCSLLRIDHAGKDIGKGARGSSAKADDLDAVYRMSRGDAGTVRLDLTHQRIGWIEPANLTRTEDATGIQYRVTQSQIWPAGTTTTAAILDDLGAPTNIGGNHAEQLLRDNGHPTRRKTALAAARYRRNGNHPGTTTNPPNGNPTGTTT